MKKVIQNIKAITLLVCLVLIVGSAAFAQKTQSSVKKNKILTHAEVVDEFEQMLKQTANACDKIWLETFIAPAALAAGDKEKARTYAQSMLAQAATSPPDCDAGKAVHVGNLVLGQIALTTENIAEAKRRLLAAGKMPGAQHSFSPNMWLARELLERNERAVVIEYLDLCAKSRNAELSVLRAWRTLAKKGGFPDFGYKGEDLIIYQIDAELLDMIRKDLKAGTLTKPFPSKSGKY